MKKIKATSVFLISGRFPGHDRCSGARPFSQQTAGELFEKALYVEEGQGDLQKAIGLYQDILKRFPESREIAAKALLHIGLCYEKLGLKEAQKAFQKVIAISRSRKKRSTWPRERLSLLPGARAALENEHGGDERSGKSGMMPSTASSWARLLRTEDS